MRAERPAGATEAQLKDKERSALSCQLLFLRQRNIDGIGIKKQMWAGRN